MAKIKFVREYKQFENDVCKSYDVVYDSSRLYSYYGEENVAQTVRKFMENATDVKEQRDSCFKRMEKIYQ